jgi:hypothetical protein
MTIRGAIGRVGGWHHDGGHPEFEVVMAKAIDKSERGEPVGVMQDTKSGRYHCVDERRFEKSGFRLVGRFRGETFVLEP